MLKRSSWSLVLLCCAFCLVACATNTVDIERAEASRRLGERYLADGNLTAALKEFLKAEAYYDQDHILQNDLGLAYFEKGKLDQALVHFEKAVDLKPEFAGAWNNMGIVYLQLDDWDKAINSFNHALDQLLYATPHFALNNLGAAYRGKMEYARSVESYRKAIKTQPRFSEAHRGLGLTRMAMGDYEAAIASLEKAVQYAPKYALAHYDLGLAYVAGYDREKAVHAFKKVVALVPDSALADAAKAEIRKLER